MMAFSGSISPLTVETSHSEDTVLSPRFSSIRAIGCGANGLVYVGTDATKQKDVAIKKIKLLEHRECKHALREVMILRQMNHENVILLLEVLDAQGQNISLEDQERDLSELRHIYLIQELFQTDLHMVIQSRQLQEEHIKFVMYQIIRGLRYIHSANVLHRDIKPNNIMVNCADLQIKIGDFGLARVVDPNYGHAGHLTAHVGMWWYRSPELILTPDDYSKATDIWSAGSIFGEMLLGGEALFPGSHNLDQILQIIDGIQLEDTDWDLVMRTVPNKLLKNHPLRPRKPLQGRFSKIDPEAIGLLEALLTFDSKKRVTAEEVLSHPYFEEYSCPEDEPVAAWTFHIEHEVDNLPVNVLRRQLTRECSSVQGVNSDSAFRHSNSANAAGHSTTSMRSHSEETHTLEQILSLPAHTDTRHSTEGTHTSWQPGRDRDWNCYTDREYQHCMPGETESSMDRDVALNNLKNTCSAIQLAPLVHSVSPSIFDFSGAMSAREYELQMAADSHLDIDCCQKQKKKGEEEEEGEKDVADCSPRKIREDLEIGMCELQQYHKSNVNTDAVMNSSLIAVTTGDDSSTNNQITTLMSHLGGSSSRLCRRASFSSGNIESVSGMIPVQDLVNLEHSDLSDHSTTDSNVERENSPVDLAALQLLQMEISSFHLGRGLGPSHQDPNIKDDANAKQQLKAEKLEKTSISRKLILDKIETEKEKEAETAQDHSTLTNEEYDELYRLPTAHLDKDLDCASERFKKEKHWAKLRQEYHKVRRAHRRTSVHHHNRSNNLTQSVRVHQEINERLKGERLPHHSLEGACGGYDHFSDHSDHSETDEIIHGILSDSSYCHPSGDISIHNQGAAGTVGNIELRIGSLPQHISSVDPLSSPESPPSPPNSRSGARPKKSPKKQRAL